METGAADARDRHPHLTRRAVTALLVGAGGLLAGCAARPPASTVGGAPTAPAVTAGTDPAARAFLALSALLTGVAQDRLDPDAANSILAALQESTATMALLTELQSKPGSPPASFDELTARGALSQPELRSAARAVAQTWYSGEVSAGNGASQSVTYQSALGWRALSFTAAPGVCGGQFGHWSAPPA